MVSRNGKAAAPPDEIVGIVERVVWTADDGSFVIVALTDKITVKGHPPAGGLTSGLTYRFSGKWEAPSKYGRQFKFTTAAEQQPCDRNGVVQYLRKYAMRIGLVTANKLFDLYGSEAINVLKNDPQRAARECDRLPIEAAREAADTLKENQAQQETRIRLMSLIGGKGFGEQAISECIKQWGAHAPDVVRRDPFKLMVSRIRGAGYLRCDRLWIEYGLPLDKMRRQVMAAWEFMRSDMSGSTWHSKADVIENVKRLITGNARPERAVGVALRAGLFTQCEREGRLWLAERRRAEDEDCVARKLEELL